MNHLQRISYRFYRFWKILGPGLVTGASDDDPSGIATYSQAGAGYGLSTLWTALITFPLMASIQDMCARIGLISNKDKHTNGITSNILGFAALALMIASAVILIYLLIKK